MATCKDCICYEILCQHALSDDELELCQHFKNKADFVKVKHGEWKEVTQKNITLTLCSICGRRTPRGIYNNDFYSDYCPHCGAKMDGGNK